jgi:UDP-N-acetylmuramyl pentapeptide phosphotransferase/UDP-N-acetylglucosamine-1-phosphate transferase
MIQALQQFLEHRWLQIIITFGVACWVSIRAIPVVKQISVAKNLMKESIARSAHVNPTPTLGGVAVYAAMVISYFLWGNPDGGNLLHLAFVAITLLFFTGVKDDIIVLSPDKKMVVQILASSLVIVGADLRLDNLFGIFGIHEIPYIVSFPLTVFVFIALINAMNLIDGIDGLAGGIGLIASLAFGTWFYLTGHYALACLAASMAGGLAGFLRFNFSKTSKVFMGDTGSLIVGFSLALFAIEFIQLNLAHRFDGNAYLSAPILAIVILIVPIFDTLRVFIIRILDRRSPFEADKNHMHHILLAQGLTHFQSSLILWTGTVLTIGVFLAIHPWFDNTQSLCLVASLFLMYLYLCYALKKRAGYTDPSLELFQQRKQSKQEAKARLKKIKRMRKLFE